MTDLAQNSFGGGLRRYTKLTNVDKQTYQTDPRQIAKDFAKLDPQLSPLMSNIDIEGPPELIGQHTVRYPDGTYVSKHYSERTGYRITFSNYNMSIAHRGDADEDRFRAFTPGPRRPNTPNFN